MCCDAIGAEGIPNGECPSCGMPTVDGETKEKCGYSPVECEECGYASCDGAC